MQDVGITQSIQVVAQLLTQTLTAGMEDDDEEKKPQAI